VRTAAGSISSDQETNSTPGKARDTASGREQSIKVGHETLATPGPNYDAPRIGGFKRKTLV